MVESDALSVADPAADSDRQGSLDLVDTGSELSVNDELPNVPSSSDELSVFGEADEARPPSVIVDMGQGRVVMIRAWSVRISNLHMLLRLFPRAVACAPSLYSLFVGCVWGAWGIWRI